MVTTRIECKREIQVCDIPDECMLITDSQDIDPILEYFDRPDWMDYGCYFVEVLDGEYGRIYGCESNIPYNHYWVDTLKLIFE